MELKQALFAWHLFFKTTQDAAGLHTFLYAGTNGALSGESLSGGLLGGAVVTLGYDAQRRRDQITWSWGSGQSRTTGLSFDGAGRLHTVTAFGKTATYGYEAATGRLDTLSYNGGGNLTGDWDYDERGRLDKVSWTSAGQVVSLHDYGYHATMDRRTSALRETGDEWRYGYNLRGELTTAAKAQGTAANAPLWKGLVRGYGYDGIGNRTTETVDTPTGTQTLDWTPNAVNQITEREVARGKWVLARVHPEATLDVTGASGSVQRAAGSEDFAIPVEAGGSSAAESVWKGVGIHASRAGVGKNGGPVQRTLDGSLWFPGSPESLAYDEDGNLTSDGRWTYTWDAENRLKTMETPPAALTAGVPASRLEFAYDAQGRRVRKALYQLETLNSQPGTWALRSDLRFLYDGWNLIAELEKHGETTPRLVRAYAWGRDLSGTERGAGGVGGLVLVQQQSTRTGNGQPQTTVKAPAYDGNGNISACLELASGRVSARLDYDAFGKPVWSELSSTVGGASGRIPFGFSTKYEDRETGLLYYGHRHYSPELGRWTSRDPMFEVTGELAEINGGGPNLYGMCGNDVIGRWDYLGLLIQLQWHVVVRNDYHTLIRVTPDCQLTWSGDSRFLKDDAGKLYVTFGAGPEPTVNGLLVSRLNRDTDAAPHAAGITLNRPTPWRDEDAFIRHMFDIDARYPDNLDYDLLPALAGSGRWWLADDGYNSNSFISGFIDAVGFQPNQRHLSTFLVGINQFLG